jgi:2-polyprenyl-6-methoxyphenol hydroxylase-like FAD-dependent oxidoreductase
MSDLRFESAVVIGGSIAGLLAASALAEHFEVVTVIDKDLLTRDATARKGVPQARHLHVLLARGLLALERRFPDLRQELIASGAILVEGGRELAWNHLGAWRVSDDRDLKMLSMSRPLLESAIAKQVRLLSNVRFCEGVRVVGFETTHSQRVTGVRVAAAERNDFEMPADLVVDASGRGSATPRFLEALGLEAPKTEHISARISYSTCAFSRSRESPAWRGLVIAGAPARRGAVILPIEGDRWLVSLAGYFDEQMPASHAEFRAFARSLPTAALSQALDGEQPLSDVVQHSFPGSQRRRYDRLKSVPDGLLVLGDALCSFNPVYGQGMTVSALEAEELSAALSLIKAKGLKGPELARRWLARTRPIIDAAWDGVSIEDLRFPELRARRPLRLRAAQWYVGCLHRATYRDQHVTNQFYRVLSFMDPPSKLFAPRIAGRVLLGRQTSGQRASTERKARRV